MSWIYDENAMKHAHEFPICYANACKLEKEAHMIPVYICEWKVYARGLDFENAS